MGAGWTQSFLGGLHMESISYKSKDQKKVEIAIIK